MASTGPNISSRAIRMPGVDVDEDARLRVVAAAVGERAAAADQQARAPARADVEVAQDPLALGASTSGFRFLAGGPEFHT